MTLDAVICTVGEITLSLIIVAAFSLTLKALIAHVRRAERRGRARGLGRWFG